MANRSFYRQQSIEREVKTIFAEISFGASGAPTLEEGLGIASVTRNDAGDFTITLDDAWSKLMAVSPIFENTTEEDIRVQIDDFDLSASSKTINLYTLTDATATDPADGTKLYIAFHLRNGDSVAV